MIAIVMSSFVVLLLARYIGDTIKYSNFFVGHQRLRQESFAMINNMLASIVREASAIDYAGTDEDTLSLFMDKYEWEKIKIEVRKDPDADSDISQLSIVQGDKMFFLNSPKTYVYKFEVGVPEVVNGTYDEEDKYRDYQQMVRIKLSTRAQRKVVIEDRNAEDYGFFELPRISYSGAYTLRNYSFSNLRN